MKANIKKISELTGYSLATVSNAITGNRGVSQEAANKILAAARKIGYLEGTDIKKIRYVAISGRSHVVETIPQYHHILQGIEEQARVFGYEIAVERIDIYDEEARNKLQALLLDKSQGLILECLEMPEEFKYMLDSVECPMIAVNLTSRSSKYDTVSLSVRDGMLDCVLYMKKKGHDRIGYLKSRNYSSWFAQEEKGFWEGCQEAGYARQDVTVLEMPILMNECYEAMKQYLDNEPELPSAFITDGDTIAAGAMKAFAEKGIRVPEDVSVLGFGDMMFCKMLTPELSTVHLHMVTLGIMAVKILHEVIANPRFVRMQTMIGTFIVERESVAEHKN